MTAQAKTAPAILRRKQEARTGLAQPTQWEVLLKWLQAHQRITTLQARNELGIMHPAGRVQELRSAGYDIATHWQREADASGKEHKQALYVLVGL